MLSMFYVTSFTQFGTSVVFSCPLEPCVFLFSGFLTQLSLGAWRNIVVKAVLKGFILLVVFRRKSSASSCSSLVPCRFLSVLTLS